LAWFTAFHVFCSASGFSLHLDDLLELFFNFLCLLAVLHEVLDSRFKLYAFVVNGLIKGEIEKPSCQFLGLIVMSH
jgi:hypothetical protein